MEHKTHFKKKKKKTETSKVLCTVVMIFSFIGAAICFLLAFLEKSSVCETLAVTMFTGGVVDIVGYLTYQGAMKNSRNKYGIDVDGVPYYLKQTTETTEIVGNPEENEF